MKKKHGITSSLNDMDDIRATWSFLVCKGCKNHKFISPDKTCTELDRAEQEKRIDAEVCEKRINGYGDSSL